MNSRGIPLDPEEMMADLEAMAIGRFLVSSGAPHALSPFAADPIRRHAPACPGGMAASPQMTIHLWTSVESEIDAIRASLDRSMFRIELGHIAGEFAGGLPARAREPFEQRRLRRIANALQGEGFESAVDAHAEGEERIGAARWAATAEEALCAIESLISIVFAKLGMEAALRNLIRVRGNVEEVDDENLDRYFDSGFAPAGAALMVELTDCIRCRAKWQETVDLTRRYPGIRFGFVFLTKSRAAFKKKVFGQLRPDIVRGGLVAPMALLVQGGEMREAVATTLEDAPPAPGAFGAAFERRFGPPAAA
ncbi:MAG: hypothetical protein BWZ10_00531 [candidate division BRC1 bacterium ADurb.BinA364]|nr:MAG: hypothetical protein BWZ10_00531 [candidate division BRC1 bacterium ADurb.BinA364]